MLHAGKVLLVFFDSSPHLGDAISLSDQPLAQNWRDFPHISGLKAVEPDPVDVGLARRPPDSDFHFL
jgi:hypothetical protein